MAEEGVAIEKGNVRAQKEDVKVKGTKGDIWKQITGMSLSMSS